MALAVKAFGSGRFRRLTEQSAANVAATVNTNTLAVAHRLVGVFVKYSSVPVQAGVTTDLDSGAGAAWDTRLNTGATNAQATAYQPVDAPTAAEDDGFLVTAPAGGAAITSQITAIVEIL